MKKNLIILLTIFTLNACSSNGNGLQCPNIALNGGYNFSGSLSAPGIENTIQTTDPGNFNSISYQGRGSRSVFDRRVDDYITVNAFLFDANYAGEIVEFIVNPEFATQEAASKIIANQGYAKAVGQLPLSLRSKLKTVTIHKGTKPFGGGNNNILIHSDAMEYHGNILEETLLHEAVHVSLSADYNCAAGWREAQTKDNKFISKYAQDNATREDLSESFLFYYAQKERNSRLSDNHKQIIIDTMSNRNAYLGIQNFNLSPQ